MLQCDTSSVVPTCVKEKERDLPGTASRAGVISYHGAIQVGQQC